MNDRVEIKLFADLRIFYPRGNALSLSEPKVIWEVLDKLQIPEQKVSIILKNGKHANLEDIVTPGDRLALFPPLGGG